MQKLDHSIGQIWIEMERFHCGDSESTTREERMTLIHRAYNHAYDAVDGLEALRGQLSARAFEEVDDAVRAAWLALRAVVLKTRPIDLDLHDDFFYGVERFAQAFLIDHKEPLRRACGWLYGRTESPAVDAESRQVSMCHGMAAILYAKHRTGLKEDSTYPRKRICQMLNSPEHRVGKEYLRQSVLNLAAADEAAAAAEDDRKTEKLRGKNKKSVTHKL